METAQIFKNGRSQAVRIPKKFRLSGEKVFVKAFGGGILLLPKNGLYEAMAIALEEFESGFVMKRSQIKQKPRLEIQP